MSKLTKIVCTLGPSSDDYNSIKELAIAGMDFARFNFSHGDYVEHGKRIEIVNRLSKENIKVKMIQDLPGPKIRVGNIKDKLLLKEGSKVKLADSRTNIDGAIPVMYDDFLSHVSVDSTILLSDGAIRLKTIDVGSDSVMCLVENGGILTSKKGINIIGTSSEINPITPLDIQHIKFGIENKFDFIAVSFITSQKEIEFVRSIIAKEGANTPIIAKIEKKEALDNLEGIINASDVVMVARGDLGVEIGVENVPIAQKKIIKTANELGKPVITATQMLYSMVKNGVPTRAEVSDIANAIIDGTDALMLSEETTVGEHPLEAVKVLNRIALKMEGESQISNRLVNRMGSYYKKFLE